MMDGYGWQVFCSGQVGDVSGCQTLDDVRCAAVVLSGEVVGRCCPTSGGRGAGLHVSGIDMI